MLPSSEYFLTFCDSHSDPVLTFVLGKLAHMINYVVSDTGLWANLSVIFAIAVLNQKS